MRTFHTHSSEGPGHGRRGGALALVMIAVVAVAALSMSMFQLTGAVTKRQASSVNRKLSFYMAEAGLAEAYAGLVIGKTGTVGTELDPARFGHGLFWVVSTVNPDGTVTLQSTGMVGNGRAELSLVVAPAGQGVAALGFFSDEGLQVEPGVQIDAWDSEEGGYGDPPPEGTPLEPAPVEEPLGRLGSNGGIVLEGDSRLTTVIEADVTPGQGQELVVGENVTVTGSTRPALAAKTLPPVEVPVLTQTAGIAQGAGTPLLLQAGKSSLEFLTVKAGGQVVIEGPSVLVLGSLALEEGADITFDPTNGTIGIYVEGPVDLAAGATLDVVGEEAHKVVLQVAGAPEKPVVLAAAGQFYGLVYAPEADVVVFPDFEAFGSVVARTLQLEGQVKLHYDEHLAVLAAEVALPRLVSWRIIELSNPMGMAPGSDPFQFLGLDPALLGSPADRHQSVFLKVEYLDLLGNPQTYEGAESAFDWNQVTDVLEISRDGKSVDPDGRGLTDIASTNDGILAIK